jgi:integrase
VTVYSLDPLLDSRHRTAAAARDQADWLQYLKVENKAARTLDTYERYTAAILRAFPAKPFGEITDGDLIHVLAGYPAASRHIVKACWNNWFRWGYKQRRIPGNPVDLLPNVKYRPPRTFDVFTAAEAEALCALPTPNGPLMTLLFWTGLRRAEARFLTGKRLDLERLQMLVTDGAKGSKSRIVPMVDRVSQQVSELLTLEGIGPDDHLWYTHAGRERLRRDRPISDSRFQDWWRKSLEAAGIRYRRPHLTRHTFATRMREVGLEMEQIQLLLGHESIRTTSDTYVHSDLAAVGVRMRELVG